MMILMILSIMAPARVYSGSPLPPFPQHRYEQPDHTITMRESDGDGGAQQYLPDDPSAEDLFVVTVARECPPHDAFCIRYTLVSV
jgi:hypothetical protein